MPTTVHRAEEPRPHKCGFLRSKVPTKAHAKKREVLERKGRFTKGEGLDLVVNTCAPVITTHRPARSSPHTLANYGAAIALTAATLPFTSTISQRVALLETPTGILAELELSTDPLSPLGSALAKTHYSSQPIWGLDDSQFAEMRWTGNA